MCTEGVLGVEDWCCFGVDLVVGEEDGGVEIEVRCLDGGEVRAGC